ATTRSSGRNNMKSRATTPDLRSPLKTHSLCSLDSEETSGWYLFPAARRRNGRLRSLRRNERQGNQCLWPGRWYIRRTLYPQDRAVNSKEEVKDRLDEFWIWFGYLLWRRRAVSEPVATIIDHYSTRGKMAVRKEPTPNRARQGMKAQRVGESNWAVVNI